MQVANIATVISAASASRESGLQKRLHRPRGACARAPIATGGLPTMMDVQTLDPDDDAAVEQWADRLGVPVERLREAIDAIGTDVDKIKAWLASPGADPAASR